MDAIVRQIKKRRKINMSQFDPVTLKEKRALDRTTIETHLKGLRNLLTPWNNILERCLQGKQSRSFLPLKSVGDFIDGLEVFVAEAFNVQKLQRYFKDFGLDVHPPKVRKKTGHFRVKLSSGPYYLEHNIPI